MEQSPKNVLGKPLRVCCMKPTTGFYRTGLCETGAQDLGKHIICIQATDEFLEFSKKEGNDLSTPLTDFQFPGLVAGDKWCLCMTRWVDAYKAGKAPKIVLSATHESALDFVSLDVLKQFAVDI